MKKVIFVDDSRTVLASVDLAVSPLVESNLIKFDSFNKPVEFLEKIKNSEVDYDLLFIDINMPEISGLELAKELKSLDKFKQKPILVLSTESSPEIKQAGKEIRVAGWVTKPFSDEKIVKAIKKILNV